MFDSNYEVILADTEASRAIHRKIRYHVYCLERQFENPAAFPTGEEFDDWDAYAAQFIVRERNSGKWVAAMRLVLPEAGQFPVEALRCLTPESTNGLHRRELAEISRICVIHSPAPYEINRRLNQDFGSIARNGEPEILLGLLRTIFVYGLKHGIEHSYLLVTDALARLLRRIGVVLHSAGTSTNHRGLRTPYWVGLRESATSMSAKSDVIRHLFARKALAYQPFSAIDDAMEEAVATMPPRYVPLPTAKTSWRVDVRQSRPGPGVWRIETTYSKPGPGVWRPEAERSKPGPGIWRSAAPG
jgi:N-acyl amino acid synthase of PEP-CTERM/exosortase system